MLKGHRPNFIKRKRVIQGVQELQLRFHRRKQARGEGRGKWKPLSHLNQATLKQSYAANRAARQTLISSIVSSNTLSTMLSSCSKIREFRSFHINRCTKIATVSKSCRTVLGAIFLAVSHSECSTHKKSREGQWMCPERRSRGLDFSSVINFP
jgi:hypothetical protein